MPAQLIPIKIDDDEILLRYIFTRHINKRNEVDSKIIFFDNRGGISLQRFIYCCNTCSKTQAKLIENKSDDPKMKFLGFVAFKSIDLNTTIGEFKKLKKDFECELVYSPIDSNDKYIDISNHDINTAIEIDSTYNYAHADISITNPGNIEPDTPNIALKAFSHLLFKVCKINFDSDHNKNSDFRGQDTMSLFV